MRRSTLPALLFLLAAGGTLFLGSRILESERSSAERTARERLKVRAREAAVTLVAEAARLLGEAATGTPDVVQSADGTFLVPAPRIPLAPIALSPLGDPESDFYRVEAERAEAVDGDLDRALGLYRAVTKGAHDTDHRLVALFRIAALERRRGAANEAARAETEFLHLLPSTRRQSLEALVVRARVRPPDADLQRDLLLLLGGGQDGVAEGFLREADLHDAVALEGRRRELGNMGRVRAPAGERAWICDGRIVAFAPAVDGMRRFRIGSIPALPDGVQVEAASNREIVARGGFVKVPSELPGIVEWVEVGDPLPRSRIIAFESLSGIEAEARRGAWMLGGALAALVLAGGAALVLSVRAARRETEAARARADFVTKVGHDLRTPLAVVRMYAETLAAGRVADPAEAREFAAVAAREAERLTGMVGQVLDLSRVAEPALARTRLDLAALAAEVAEIHRPLLQHAGIRLEVRAAGPLPVLGDSASLRGAVSNLLENAQRHAASGGSVEIESARDGTMAVVRVLDRGPGLPAGMEDRVFERFVRGPEAAGSGAGRGLALVREAAAADRGAARAADREGGGAAFSVSVPLAEEEA